MEYLSGVKQHGGVLHVKERTPRFGASAAPTCDAGGVTVMASVWASDIWVYHEIRAELGRRQQIFYFYMPHIYHCIHSTSQSLHNVRLFTSRYLSRGVYGHYNA